MTIGSNLHPELTDAAFGNVCGGACTLVNDTLPAGAVRDSPISGVIVRWRLRQTLNVAGPGKLRVLKAASLGLDPMWTGIRSGETVPLPADAGTYEFPTRLSISAGDSIGLDAPAGHGSVVVTVPGDKVAVYEPELANGATEPRDAFFGAELTLNADVELDADGDGFGDETQDACPTNGAIQTVCPTPPAVLLQTKKKCKKGRKLVKRKGKLKCVKKKRKRK